MAIQIKKPLIATFIHVPKTGGTSIQKWLFKNFQTEKKNKHCTLQQAQGLWEELGWTFACVRNPWDRCVSVYFFAQEQLNNKLAQIEQGTLPKPWKEHNRKEYVLKRLENYNKGFEHFLLNQDDPLLEQPQTDFVDGVDCVIKTNNLNDEFKIIQDKLECYEPLSVRNTSNHKKYTQYYDDKTKDIVYRKYNEEIKKFNFEFGE